MNTNDIAKEYRLSHWAGIMADRTARGLSIKDYCEMAGLHQNVYFYWQRKLRDAACELLAKVPDDPTPGFTEVRMIEAPAEPETAVSGQTGQLQIEISGIRIAADHSYPSDKLAVLLRELARVC